MNKFRMPPSGVGRGAPIVERPNSPQISKRDDGSSGGGGLYGVDCDFARKTGKEEREKSKEERSVSAAPLDDAFGFNSRNDGRRKNNLNDELFSGNRERGRRSRHVGFQIPVEIPSSGDTSDDGITYGGGRGRRRTQRGKYREDRARRDGRHVSSPLTLMGVEQQFAIQKFGDHFGDYQSKRDDGRQTPQHEQFDYDHIPPRRFSKYEDDDSEFRPRRGGRGGRAGNRGGRGGNRGGYGGRGGGYGNWDGPPIAEMTCYNCGETGHFSRDCTQEQKVRMPVDCWNCGQTGHISRNCPESQNVDSTPILIDLSEFPALQNEECNVVNVEIAKSSEKAKQFFADIASVTVEADSGSVVEIDTGVEYEFIQVDQLNKKEELYGLLGDEYRDSAAPCACKLEMELFKKCQCKKSFVVVVSRRMTVECVRVLLASRGITVGSIHCSMIGSERQRNLSHFQKGRWPILILMASELSACVDALKDVDWLLNFDLPSHVDEFKARVELMRQDGKVLLVTSFFDVLMDNPLAEDLSEVLENAGQPIPEWMAKLDLDGYNEFDLVGNGEE